jgi:hypothetical protein
MTTPILRKVWGDLARNKARTLLAVLSIAAGVFALGLAFGALRGHAGLHQQDKARVFSDAVGNAAFGTSPISITRPPGLYFGWRSCWCFRRWPVCGRRWE